jgi:GxxExxY protein
MLRIKHEDTKARRLDARMEEIATQIVDAVFKVHSALGPGLLESVYEICLAHELHLRGLKFERQVTSSVVYEGLKLDAGLRLDLLVEDSVVIEIKAVEILTPVHKAQLLTYLKLSNHRLGFLINFNTAVLKEGLKRIIL